MQIIDCAVQAKRKVHCWYHPFILKKILTELQKIQIQNTSLNDQIYFLCIRNEILNYRELKTVLLRNEIHHTSANVIIIYFHAWYILKMILCILNAF